MAKQDNQLTAKQKLFCEFIVRGVSGTQSAIKAGYSTNGASTQAIRLLANAMIQAEITRLRTPVVHFIEVTQINTLRELAAIAHADPALLFDAAGAIIPIRQMPEQIRRAIQSVEFDKAGRLIKVRLAHKVPALMLLGRYHNLFDQPVPPPAGEERAAGLDQAAAVELIQKRTPGMLTRPSVTDDATSTAQPVNGNGTNGKATK